MYDFTRDHVLFDNPDSAYNLTQIQYDFAHKKGLIKWKTKISKWFGEVADLYETFFGLQ